ncbi:response regulator [Methanoregula sp.]|uniref:response regulator n=1 Tax=Methanoregula sp. TaxID=2052170 RepID=UPI003569C105
MKTCNTLSPDETTNVKPHTLFRRILVVEDSRTQAEFLVHLLKERGYDVLLAHHGREALETIHREWPAVVLTDIIMPEMDGYDLCREIKAGTDTAGIQVILVTQLFDAEDVLRGLEAGADNFIIKPYDPGQVYSHIEAAFRSAGTKDPEGPQPGLAYLFSGRSHRITSGRSRILDILLTTYECAVRKNAELQEAQETQSELNEELTAAVDELHTANRNLSDENTERARMEKALADANSKLNLLTSITRHDILNQLTALGAYLSLAGEHTKDPIVAGYLAQCEKIAGSVNEHVEFMKDYQDLGIHAPVWQDLNAIVRKSMGTCARGGITVHPLQENVEILADPLFEKVIHNLLDNAIRHGERVTDISFTARKTSAGLCIICKDNGVGVAREDKGHIFKKGFGKHTGLGLFLSRELLGITEITITETGIYGQGARFEILVPEGGYRQSGR